MQTFNAVKSAKVLLAEKLQTARLVVDATAGNGYDTLFLAKNTPQDTDILAFDIQQSAIESTKKLLAEENLLYKVQLYCTSHADLLNYLEGYTGIDIAMFNLGYLPGCNHRVVTTADSTLQAVKAVIDSLNPGGVLSITAYPGHEEGAKEEQELHILLANLPAKAFTVIRLILLNHLNNPPVLYMIEKV
jgi:methylase of polypeptide subunit release factors